MRLRWRKRALDDLERIHAWLSTLDGADPDRAILRIQQTANRLTAHDIGRPGLRDGTREVSVSGGPYVIVFRIADHDIDVLAVYHTAQRRPDR